MNFWLCIAGTYNDSGLPGQAMRPVPVHSMSTTKAFLNPADNKGAQFPISPFTQSDPGMSCLSIKESANA